MKMKISGIKDDTVRSEMEDYSIGYTAMVYICRIDRQDKKMVFTKINECECEVQYV